MVGSGTSLAQISQPVSSLLYVQDFQNIDKKTLGFADGAVNDFWISSRRGYAGPKSLCIFNTPINTDTDAHLVMPIAPSQLTFEYYFTYDRTHQRGVDTGEIGGFAAKYIDQNGNRNQATISIRMSDGAIRFKNSANVLTVLATLPAIPEGYISGPQTIGNMTESWNKVVLGIDFINNFYNFVGINGLYFDMSANALRQSADTGMQQLKLEFFNNSSVTPVPILDSSMVYYGFLRVWNGLIKL